MSCGILQSEIQNVIMFRLPQRDLKCFCLFINRRKTASAKNLGMIMWSVRIVTIWWKIKSIWFAKVQTLHFQANTNIFFSVCKCNKTTNDLVSKNERGKKLGFLTNSISFYEGSFINPIITDIWVHFNFKREKVLKRKLNWYGDYICQMEILRCLSTFLFKEIF